MSLSALQQQEDEAGILRSQAYFHSLIAEQVEKGVPSNRIVLGGFSQGGAMSLLAGLTCPQKLGGIFGLSSYLLLQGKLKEMIAEKGNANKDTKIFMGKYIFIHSIYSESSFVQAMAMPTQWCDMNGGS
jgi:predicted esterase